MASDKSFSTTIYVFSSVKVYTDVGALKQVYGMARALILHCAGNTFEIYLAASLLNILLDT